jgi:uncharacterized protein (DUF305 family)
MNRTLTAIALSAALAVSVSGCSADFLESFNFAGGEPSSNSETPAPEFSQDFSHEDVMFAQMMIVHHEQAIDMSELAKTNTTNPEIHTLAESISRAQVAEVATMKSWLVAAGSMADHAHDMTMHGLADEATMAELRTLTGSAFDSLFLMTMIQHHEGAIVMADEVLASTLNDDVTALVNQIKSTQTLEIEAMYALLGP